MPPAKQTPSNPPPSALPSPAPRKPGRQPTVAPPSPGQRAVAQKSGAAKARPPALAPTAAAPLPEVSFSDLGDQRCLHLGTEWVQGTMRLSRPLDIDLEYVQRMMAWLLFVSPQSVPQRHAMQLGLGAGALTKFCRCRLHMRTTAVELNPRVLAACRLWFKLPPEDARLRVVLADAGEEIRNPRWAGSVDALQVDLYDHEAAAPVLDSADFYRHCRAVLTEEGCMSVNLFGSRNRYPESVEKIAAAFGPEAVWLFKPTREGNTVVLAQATPTRPNRAEWEERAALIQARWGLPAPKWLKSLKPIQNQPSA